MGIELLPFGQSHADKCRAGHYKWLNAPPGMSPEMAAEFMDKLKAGTTIRKLTGGGKLGPAMVSRERYLKHCKLNPTWAAEAKRISDANVLVLKGAWARLMTHCKLGLHPLVGDNVKIHSTTGLRYCAACRRETDKRIPTPLTESEKENFKSFLSRGSTVNQLIHGTPVGGGKRNKSLIVALPKDFYHARATDPEFDKFVSVHIANSGSIGQRARWRRVKTLALTSSARSETNDYYSIRALIPVSIPDRDDIVSRIFEDLLGGVLQRENVRSHIAGSSRPTSPNLEMPAWYR